MAKNPARQILLSPSGLMRAIEAIFPDFQPAQLDQEIADGEASIHTVWVRFSEDFRATDASEAQLTRLSALLAECVSIRDDLENAASTCFLEHLGQIDHERRLWSALPRQVRDHMKTF
jgi:hypothetical protein